MIKHCGNCRHLMSFLTLALCLHPKYLGMRVNTDPVNSRFCEDWEEYIPDLSYAQDGDPYP